MNHIKTVLRNRSLVHERCYVRAVVRATTYHVALFLAAAARLYCLTVVIGVMPKTITQTRLVSRSVEKGGATLILKIRQSG